MNEYNYQKEVYEAIQCANNALYWLNDANAYLNSAGGWGIVDILGGGIVSTLFKHSKIDKARYSMEQAKYAVKGLKKRTARC